MQLTPACIQRSLYCHVKVKYFISDLCPVSLAGFICIRTFVWSFVASPTLTRRRILGQSHQRNYEATSMVLPTRNFRQGAEPRGSFHGVAVSHSARLVPFTQRFSRDQLLFLEFQTDLLEMMPEKSFTSAKNDREKELIENLCEYGLFKRRTEDCKKKRRRKCPAGERFL